MLWEWMSHSIGNSTIIINSSMFLKSSKDACPPCLRNTGQHAITWTNKIDKILPYCCKRCMLIWDIRLYLLFFYSHKSWKLKMLSSFRGLLYFVVTSMTALWSRGNIWTHHVMSFTLPYGLLKIASTAVSV